MDPLKVAYRRSRKGGWIAWAPSLKGCRAQGATLVAARLALRKVMAITGGPALEGEAAFKAQIIEEIALLPEVEAALAERRLAGRELLVANKRMDQATRRAVALLVDRMGLSFRDAATLLRLSPARVFQITRETGLARKVEDRRVASARVAAFRPRRR